MMVQLTYIDVKQHVEFNGGKQKTVSSKFKL